MKNIVFFNYAHKGDIFFSRPFIKDIMNQIDAEYWYAHYWENYLVKDMGMKYISLDNIPKVQSNNEHAANFIKDDNVYINTWIGRYFSHSKPMYGDCNLKSLYQLVYSEIFDFLGKAFDVNIHLKDIYEYFPSINYSHYNISSVDKFLENNLQKKILFCNGPALSGQCDECNGDMESTIFKMSNKYKNICFITTHKLNIVGENIKYTGDIIDNEGQDLNEISYLSKYCDLIIGKSSGPFSFTNTKENLFSENKTFLCYGKKPIDSIPYGLEVECQYIYEEFSTLENLENTIIGLIEE
jgi:hypothetical protein